MSEPNPPTKGYLPLLIPVAVLLMLQKIPLLLLTVGGWGSWRLWNYYQQRQQNQLANLDEVFYRLIRENQGRITPLDLAMHSKISGTTVQQYLDQKAVEFSAQFDVTDQGGIIYYFETAQSIPVSELELKTTQPETPQPVQLFPMKETTLKPTEIKLPPLQDGLNQSELAQRLGVHPNTLSKWKTKPEFPLWSSQRDPDAIAWCFSPETRRFSPQTPKPKKGSISELMRKNKV